MRRWRAAGPAPMSRRDAGAGWPKPTWTGTHVFPALGLTLFPRVPRPGRLQASCRSLPMPARTLLGLRGRVWKLRGEQTFPKAVRGSARLTGGDGSVRPDTGEGPPLLASGRLPDPGLAQASPGVLQRLPVPGSGAPRGGSRGRGQGRARPTWMPAASRSREGSSGVRGQPGVVEAAARQGPRAGVPPALPFTRRRRAVQLSRDEGGRRSWVLGTGRGPEPGFRSSPPSPGVSCAPDS